MQKKAARLSLLSKNEIFTDNSIATTKTTTTKENDHSNEIKLKNLH